jgi:CDP-2,3-bis-(O-geranylgeranyl)-sn-glycerol synthase
MLPAYLPNSAAAAIKGNLPIDFGKTTSTGTRILGEGKTFRGFFGGIICGILVGCVEIWICNAFNLTFLPQHSLLSVTVLATGSMLGDLGASFFKRRLHMERGQKWLLVDQYDFLIGAFLFLIIADWSWMIKNITIPTCIVIIIMTPLLHRAVNMIGYKLGFKDVPW